MRQFIKGVEDAVKLSSKSRNVVIECDEYYVNFVMIYFYAHPERFSISISYERLRYYLVAVLTVSINFSLWSLLSLSQSAMSMQHCDKAMNNNNKHYLIKSAVFKKLEMHFPNYTKNAN